MKRSGPVLLKFSKVAKTSNLIPNVQCIPFHTFVEEITENSPKTEKTKASILNACLVAATKAPRGCLHMTNDSLEKVKLLKKETLEIMAARGTYTYEEAMQQMQTLKSFGVPVHIEAQVSTDLRNLNRDQLMEEYSDYMDFQVYKTMELRRAARLAST